MLRNALLALGLSLVVACSAEASAPVQEPEPELPGRVTEVGQAPAPSAEEKTDEAAKPAPPPEVPVATPGAPALGGQVGKWSWLDVPEAICGNGEPTGLGVNLGTSEEVVIFMMGGRACWDDVTCTAGLGKNVRDGYPRAVFEEDLAEGSFADTTKTGILARGLAENPYKDASYIAVPYCTGDVHAGDAAPQYFLPPRTMHYSGRKNVQAFLAKIVPAFPKAKRVTLVGVSAGGFGAAINFWRVQDAFGKIRVDLIDDAGPPFEGSEMPLLNTWRSAWNLDGAVPPGCPECKTNLAALPGYYAKTYPSSRFAFSSFDQDAVISLFFATPPPIFAHRLDKMATNRIAPHAMMRVFIPSGTTHTMMEDLSIASGSLSLGSWLGQMHSDSPAWASATP